MRALAPTILHNYRAKRVRWCIYHIAGKVVRSGRQLQFNIAIAGYHVTERLLAIFQAVVPPPERIRTNLITIFNYIIRPNHSGVATSPLLLLLFGENGRSCSKTPRRSAAIIEVTAINESYTQLKTLLSSRFHLKFTEGLYAAKLRADLGDHSHNAFINSYRCYH